MRKTLLAIVWAAALAGCSRKPAELPVEFPHRDFDAGGAGEVMARDRSDLGDWRPQGEQAELVENLKLFNRRTAAGQEADDVLERLGSQARRLLESLDYLDDRLPGVVLDVGAGPGRASAFMKKRWPKSRIASASDSRWNEPGRIATAVKPALPLAPTSSPRDGRRKMSAPF